MDGHGLGGAEWVRLASISNLATKDRQVVKSGNKQIALFMHDDHVYACNNRCPHEGYPLSEGSLGSDCILTCNWHNWKFDLRTGETEVGGDSLAVYETRVEGDDLFVRITEPTPEEVAAKALSGLRQCFDLHEYDRMAREVARLMQSGADPLVAVRATIEWTYEHFEFGSTHAVAATADWLALVENEEPGSAKQLTAIVESIGHFAWDSRREPHHPFSPGSRKYDADDLVQAIEAEDENTAAQIIRGAYADGLGYPDIEPALAQAALAHYQDFGHSLIYTYKTGQLIERLADPKTSEMLTLMLVRSFVYASREDLIPEFKTYAPAFENWDTNGRKVASAEQLREGRLSKILEAISGGGAEISQTYDALFEACSWQLLHYDMAFQDHTDKSVSQNVGWLGFTHGLTFANAVRILCGRYPELWPEGLLQMGCFLGRNAAFIDAQISDADWRVEDPEAFLHGNKEGLFDHANPEFIVSCHLLKLLTAVAEEHSENPHSKADGMMLAAVNRFLNSPLKRKHALRTAKQALSMVGSEG